MRPMNEHPLETDLARIDALARTNWADNWNFRAYLQQHVDARAVDREAQAQNAAVAARIDCTTCGNCCREIHPYLRAKDVSRLAKGLGLTNDELRARHLQKADHGDQRFCAQPCPMLAGDRCTVYASRPDDCRSYPHLHKHGFMARSVGVIENYRVCPIVFNVYEGLKRAFAYDPATDYIGDTVIDE